MLSKKCYFITYEGHKVKLRYPTDVDIAVKEGGGLGKFQELRLLERIRAMGLTGVYVDVGANVGNHTLYFANFCPADLVIAIEAHPEIFECLQVNVQANKSSVEIHKMQLAAWNKREELWMDVPVPGNAGRSQIVGLGKFGKTPRVRTTGVPLDEVLQGHEKIGLMKFDVEDAEDRALLGARNTIKKHRPVVITESHEERQRQWHANFLAPFGYLLNAERFDPRGETNLWIPTSKEAE